MGKVTFNMTMSLDGFVAGPNDGPENGLGDGGEGLFNWYFNGDTEVFLSEGTPLLKVSKQSAELMKEAFSMIFGDAEPLTSHMPGVEIHPGHRRSLSRTMFHRNGSSRVPRSPLSPMAWKARSVRQSKLQAIRT